MAFLELPDLNFNTLGWGPADDDLPDKYKNLQKIYQPFMKKDQIGRVADWTGLSDNFRRRGRQWQSGMPNENLANMFELGDKVDEEFKAGMGSFSLVDNDQQVRKPPFQKGGFNKFNDRNNSRHVQTQEYHNNKQNNTIRPRHRMQNKRGGFNRRFPRQVNREASVKVQPDWKHIELLQLPNLSKKSMKHPTGVDVLKCGQARAYNRGKYDKISVKTKVKLDHSLIEKLEFQHPNTMDDPKLREIMKTTETKKALIIGTDNIVSTLMCMSRSQIPWDLTVHKMNKYIIFDNDKKEDENNPIDTISVSETANEQMQPDESVEEINKQPKLIVEAARINTTMTQQLLRRDAGVKIFKGKEGYPFSPSEDALREGKNQNPDRLYRYRKFYLDKEEEIALLVRTSVDAYEPGPKSTQKVAGLPNFVNIHCLNEWNSKYCSGIFWNKYLEKQSSMILATELKNNNFKIAKWIMNAKMADVTNIKLAYVQRDNVRDNQSHNLVNMETYKPEVLAQTANLNIDNCWGIFKTVIDIIMKESDGEFHIVKSPNKPDVTIYKEVGEDESESEESGSEESGSDDDESGSDEESGSEESGSDEESGEDEK